ncbi:MAG TPA: 50S ribosomal protein L25 [Gemmatirosa sp.]
MATASLSAEIRNETGKGVARKLRATGRVPAVVYGHARTPQSLSVNARELGRLLDQFSAASTVVELGLDGGTTRTLIREVQRHPVDRSLVHVDFQELVAGERVTVRVPLVFIGTPEGVRAEGGLLEEQLRDVEVSADPASIPDHIDVDVSGLLLGHPLHVRDLTLPAGITVITDADATVVMVTAARVEEPQPAAAAEAAGAPEVLRAKKADE